MKFVMNRNVTVKGLSGHAIAFKKGEPVHVPPEMIEEVMAKGGLPADGEELQTPQEEPKSPTPVGLARDAQIKEAFNALVAENDRNKFSAGGVPKIKFVREQANISDLDNRDMKERWAKYKEELHTQAD